MSSGGGNAGTMRKLIMSGMSILYGGLEKGVTGGHGGMDGLVYKAFFDAVRNRGPVPIDVYDTASWMAITPLSEESIALGGMPRAIPDFTNGQWMLRGAWEP